MPPGKEIADRKGKLRRDEKPIYLSFAQKKKREEFFSHSQNYKSTYNQIANVQKYISKKLAMGSRWANEKLHSTLKGISLRRKGQDCECHFSFGHSTHLSISGQYFVASFSNYFEFHQVPALVDLKTCQYCLRIAYDA